MRTLGKGAITTMGLCIMGDDITISKAILEQLIKLNVNMSKLNGKIEAIPEQTDKKIRDHREACSLENKDSVPPGGMEVKISSGLLKKLKIAGFALLATGVGGSGLWTTIQSILEHLK